MKVVLFGYYGHHNFGDEVMMQGTASMLAELSNVTRITVFTATTELPTSTNKKISYASIGGKSGKARLALAIAAADRVIWGGGTCIYEPENGDLGSLKFLRTVSQFARLVGRPISFCGIGIGSLKSEEAKNIAKSILRNGGFHYFRDDTSATKALELGAEEASIRLGGDLFFLTNFEKPNRSTTRNSHITFSGLHEYAVNQTIVDAYGKMLASWLSIDRDRQIVFLPMHQGTHSDNAFHLAVADQLPRNRLTILDHHAQGDFLEAIETATIHIGMRLHSVVLADCVQTPNLAINYSPKVQAYCEKSNAGAYKRVFSVGEIISNSDIARARIAYTQNVAFISHERSLALNSLHQIIGK